MDQDLFDSWEICDGGDECKTCTVGKGREERSCPLRDNPEAFRESRLTGDLVSPLSEDSDGRYIPVSLRRGAVFSDPWALAGSGAVKGIDLEARERIKAVTGRDPGRLEPGIEDHVWNPLLRRAGLPTI